MNLVVCIKQVPDVSELKWDKKTGSLKRELAEGMMDPGSRHAMETALRLKAEQGGQITVFSMGPPQAEEVVYEALALGADRGVLITDPAMAGSDTLATSHVLGRAVRLLSPDFDLVLAGAFSADSETAQIGPQLAEELAVAGVAYVESIEIHEEGLILQRRADNFLETLLVKPPGVISIAPGAFAPRFVDLAGLAPAFEEREILILDSRQLGIKPEVLGAEGSPTKFVKIYPATTEKKGIVLKGSVKKSVKELFELHSSKLDGLIGQSFAADD